MIVVIVFEQLLITLMARNAADYGMYHFQIVLLIMPLIFLSVFRVNSRLVPLAQARMIMIPLVMMTTYYDLSKSDITANIFFYMSIDLFGLYINHSLILEYRSNFLYALLNQHKQTKLKIAQSIMEQLSRTDSLTNVANRIQLQETLITEWQSAKRSQEPPIIVIVDIDHFKKFNDSYGHLLGDEYLVQVSQAISGNASRSGDLVARFGGEEFLLVLSDADAKSALLVGNRINDAIRKLAIEHKAAGEEQVVTASVGIDSLS